MTSFNFNPSRYIVYCLISAFFGICLLSWIIHTVRKGSYTTPIRGPPSKSLLFGLGSSIQEHIDSSALYQEWAREYGSVYRVPYALGSFRVVLFDPKAVAAYFSRETFIYVRDSVSKRALDRMIGRRSLIAVEGETHKIQRKALNPAFANAEIRKLTPVFFDSGYKAKVAWDALIDASQSGEALIDVQDWMKHVSLDTIGIAGFSHDFGTLNGEHPDVETAFESFSDFKPSYLAQAAFLMAFVMPVVDRIPTAAKKLAKNLNSSMKAIAIKLLMDSKKVVDQKSEDKSIMGLLLKLDKNKTVASDSSLQPDVIDHMKLLLVAGYETTSVSLSWALIELARKVDAQTKLREELSKFSAADPTWNQLTTSLPYLDAVVHEILRLHPPVMETFRVAAQDDILPLSTPAQTSDGRLVDTLAIAEGTTVVIPIMAINRSEVFWGPDASGFKPERWLMEGGLTGAKDIQGYRHLLTFGDGPRICLGKGFALAEFKAVLFTLINNFSFALPEGAEIEIARGIVPRPKVVGLEGLRLPLRVRRVD